MVNNESILSIGTCQMDLTDLIPDFRPTGRGDFRFLVTKWSQAPVLD